MKHDAAQLTEEIARRSASRKLTALVAGSCLLASLGLTTVAVPDADAAGLRSLQCRANIAAASRKWLGQTTKARQGCLLRVLRGTFPSTSAGCVTGSGDSILQKQLSRIDARLTRRILAPCSGLNLENLDYPGRCDDLTPEDSFTARDLERCVRDVGNNVIQQLLTVEYPATLGFTNPARAKCVARIGRTAFSMFSQALKARQACLLAKGAGGGLGSRVDCRGDIPPYGSGTGLIGLDRKLEKAYVTLLSSLVRACTVFDVEQNDYGTTCPDPNGGEFSLFDVKSCNFNVNRTLLPVFLAVSFPTDPVCGDGIREGNDEECDDGDDNSATEPDACRPDCTLASCGDGTTDTDEECDDGNNTSLDGCTADCIIEGCGDGVVIPEEEECDDGDDNSDTRPDACRRDCTLPSCGDNVTDSGEACDDGNTVSNDGCSGTGAPQGSCEIERCGDGIAQTSEECDDGDSNSDTEPDACRTDCTDPVCGDNITDPAFGDECDDGKNGDDLDGCSDGCALCGNGTTTAPEECDDGASNSDAQPDGCRTTCRLFFCGDGVTDSGEECDDGPSNSDTTPDACRTDCTNPVCGDNVTDPAFGDECDDGKNGDDLDGCSDGCALCGNGITTAPEECDDGAGNSDTQPDACRTDCRQFFCGDGVDDGPESCDDGVLNSDSTPDACRTDCSLPSCGDGVIDPLTNGEVCDGDGSGACASNEACIDECGTCRHLCPGFGELVLFAKTGAQCATNADCPVGTCDPENLHCKTLTDLDTGWGGLGHDSDINDVSATRGFLDCPAAGPVCGECNLIGIDPSLDNCRCANDARAICDEPFQADDDDCGGATCQCFFGAPFPLSSSGVPACIVNRFAEDVTGTANVDTGEGQATAKLITTVFTGEGTRQPCPYCGGTCGNNPSQTCAQDGDCGLCDGTEVSCTLDRDCVGRGGSESCVFGTCNGDDIPGDGIRNGICIDGTDDGLSCDVQALNTSFPVRPGIEGGGGYSLDCRPSGDKNVSGAGLNLQISQTTGRQELEAQIECFGGSGTLCHCKLCSSDPSIPCSSNAECGVLPGSCEKVTGASCFADPDCDEVNAGVCSPTAKRCLGGFSIECVSNADCQGVDAGACNPSTCSVLSSGEVPDPNGCRDGVCMDLGGGNGECAVGPDDGGCDGCVKADGSSVLTCNQDADCGASAVGQDCGTCSVIKRRSCFMDKIVAEGIADPHAPLGAAIFCVPPTSSSGINSVAGLPGPARILNQGLAQTFCRENPSVAYVPGVGNCPLE